MRVPRALYQAGGVVLPDGVYLPVDGEAVEAGTYTCFQAEPGFAAWPDLQDGPTGGESGGPDRAPRRCVRALEASDIERVLVESFALHRGSPQRLDQVAASRGGDPGVLALLLHARSELVPAIRRFEGSGEADDPLADDPLAETAVPGAAVRLPGLLVRIGLREGYTVGRGGHVLRVQSSGAVVAAGDDLPTSVHRGRRITLVPTREAWHRVKERVVSVVSKLAEAHRDRILDRLRLRAGWSRDVVQGTAPIHRGAWLEVWLDRRGYLTIRRPLASWTVRAGDVRRRFPPVDILVRIRSCPRGGPNLAEGPLISPVVPHPFVDDTDGSVCVSAPVPDGEDWVRQAFQVIDQAEAALVHPHNPEGDGGYRPLSSCPDYEPCPGIEDTR